MKYMRKTPVEAIQWTGGNDVQVLAFISRKEKIKSSYSLKDTELRISYTKKCDKYTYNVAIPILGWVVRERGELSFYKDATFRKTFEAVIDWKGVKAVTEAFCGFEVEPSKKVSGVLSTMVRLNNKGRMTKLIDDIFKDDEKTREEIKKNMSVGLKEMAGGKTKGTEFDTFESVLDEMKELHAKKNKDYGSAFHKSFEEFGVTAGVVRLNDKMERVKSLVKNGKAEVKDESILDTLKDLASYAVMLYVELKKQG